MDFRPNFFVPNEAKEQLADVTTTNLNEIKSFERAITPELAQSMADITKTYPNLDKRLIVYSALSGLQADDELVLQLSQQQQKAMEKKQRKNVNTDVNFLKRGTQLAFLAMDSAFQNISKNFKSSIVAAQETDTSLTKAVLGNTAAGLIPGEQLTESIRKSTLGNEFNEQYESAKEAYGETEFKRALGEINSGRQLNLGTGILPNSIPLEETEVYNKQIKLGKSPTQAYEAAREVYGTPITEEFERDEYQFKYQTKEGDLIPISPGRVVAAQFSQEGDIKYALASTIIDGAFRLGADPINLLLGYGAGVKTAARKVVSKAEVAQYVDDAAFMSRALSTFKPTKAGKEARRLTFGKTAEQVLDSKWGDKFIDALVTNSSVARLKDIPSFKQVDTKVLNLLAQVKDKSSMKEIVRSLLKNGDLSDLMVAPYTGAFIGKEIGEAAIGTPITKLPMKQSVVGNMANELAKKFAGQAIDVAPLRNTIGALLGKMSDDPFKGVIGLGGSLKNALPQKVSRLFDLAPSRMAAVNHIQETIENIDGIMVTLGENQETRDFFIGRLLESKTQDDIVGVVRQVNKKIEKRVIADNPDLEDESKLVNEVMTFFNKEIDEQRKYFYDQDGKALAFPGTKFKYTPQRVDELGNITEDITVAVPSAFSMGQFTENFVPLIDYKELSRSLASFRRMVGPSRTKLNKMIATTWSDPTRPIGEKILQQAKLPTRGLKENYSRKRTTLAPKTWLEYMYSDYIMQRALKPSWMLRGALALRVPPEESVRAAFYGGPNVFTHPLLLASLKSGVRQNDPTNIQVIGSLGEQLFSTRINKNEIDSIAELIGTEELQKGIQSLNYNKIQQIMKVMRLNTNVSGQVGDAYLANAIAGGNATDFAFDEIIGEVKQLGKQKVGNTEGLGQAFLDYVFLPKVLPFMNTSSIPEAAVSTSPYKKYRNVVEFTNNEEYVNAIKSFHANPEIKMLLGKKNHGLIVTKVEDSVVLEVGVQLGKVEDITKLSQLEDVIKNGLSVAIKGHQPKMYLRSSMYNLLPENHPLQSVIRQVDDVFEIQVHKTPDMRIDNIDIDSEVNKEVMEYLFDSNFQTARKIVDKKGGYAQAAPSGSFFNTDAHYLTTMSEQSLVKALKPTGKALKAGDNEYIMVDKFDPSGQINPNWWRGWIHDMITKASDPLFVVVARDGAEKALNFFTETTSGKKYINELISRSDDPAVRSVIENKDELFKYLKSTEYEIGRLQGNQTRKVFREGQEISEQEARQLIVQGENYIYPDYEVDLALGSDTVRDFIANGGFIDGQDWLELSQKYSVLSAKTDKYFGNFYDKMKDVFKKDIVELDLGPRRQAFNNNPNLTPSGQVSDTALSKWDEVLGNGYSWLLAKPSDYLNRDPLFRWSFYTLAEDIMPFMTEDVKKQFIVGSKPWIDGSDLYKNLLRKSKLPSEENTITSLEQAESLLKYKAMDEVKNLLYASSDRHVLSDVFSSYVPFPEIWQEVIKTWGKLLADNPAKFNRTRIGVERGKEAKPWDTENAFFTSDPVTGELLFNYVDVMNVLTFGLTAIPGAFGFSPLQTGLLGENLEDEGVRVKSYGFLEGLNLIAANGFSPGFGPNVTIPFSVFQKIATVPKVMNDFILGNFNQPGKGVNPIDEMPAYLKGFFKGIPMTQEATEEINASYSKTVMDLFTLYYYAGKWTPEDEQSIKIAMQEAESAASKHWLIRGFAQWGYPTGIQPRYEIQDKNGSWWTMQVLGQKYQQMLESNNYDYFTTTQQFTQKFGLNPIPLRQSTSAKKGRFPVKKDSYAFWQLNENKELMDRKPYTAIYLNPDNADDEFSLPAFMAGAEALEPNQFQRAVQQSLLQFELAQYKEELKNDKSLSATARAEKYSAYIAKKEDEYGIISYGSIGDAVVQADKYQIIKELKDWENEPLLRESPEYVPLSKFIEAYDDAIRVALNGGTFGNVTIPKGGVSGKRAARMTGKSTGMFALREELDSYARQLALEYEDTNWISMYLGSFWKELDNRRYED
tara:strand:+ start:360 stop:6386 length:6027 start_codon:yes stop_codon:yes gene_type:complete